MPEPEKFIVICKELLKIEPKQDAGREWYIDEYKLKNKLLMDIRFYPPMAYSVVPEKYNGVFIIHIGPEGAWSDEKQRKTYHTNTFDNFKTILKKVLKENV